MVQHSKWGRILMGAGWGTNCTLAAPTIDACVNASTPDAEESGTVQGLSHIHFYSITRTVLLMCTCNSHTRMVIHDSGTFQGLSSLLMLYECMCVRVCMRRDVQMRGTIAGYIDKQYQYIHNT